MSTLFGEDGRKARLHACLERIQQILLAEGYSYVAGDVDKWPMTFVQMARGGETLFVGPWLTGEVSQIAEFWRRDRKVAPGPCGLLLVGLAKTDEPVVGELFDATRGSVAYVDADGESAVVRRRSGVMTAAPRKFSKRHFRPFFDPSAAAAARAVDCRQRLQRDLRQMMAVAEFYGRARQTQPRGLAITSVVMACCILMFAVECLMSGRLGPTREVLISLGALHGPLVKDGQVWRLITCGLLHVNLLHLVFNMYALHILGRPLEIFQGRQRVLAFLAFSVVTGSIASLWYHPDIVSAGISGGLFGLVGAMGAMLVRHRRHMPPHLWRAIGKSVLMILVYNFAFLFVTFIDGAAHVGGLVGGFALGLALCRSPIRATRPSTGAWIAAAIVVVLAVSAGAYVVDRMRAVADTSPAQSLDQAVAGLDAVIELHAPQVRQIRQLLADAQAGRVVAASAAALIDKEILPDLLADRNDRLPAAVASLPRQAEKVGMAAEKLLEARIGFCSAVVKVLEGSATEIDAHLADRRLFDRKQQYSTIRSGVLGSGGDGAD